MQSTCLRKRRYTKRRYQLTVEQLAAKRARADEARMLIERHYPPEFRAGHWRGRVTWEIDGCTTVVDLFTPAAHGRRARCDSYEARIGDTVILDRGGLRAIDDLALARYVPRPLPRSAF